MKTCLPLIVCSLLCSCATITRGVHEKLTVLSDPTGADVRLSSGERGITPAKFVKNRRTDNFTVTVSKKGYVSQTIRVESKFSGTGGTAMAGNAILGGLVGIGVDAASGAYNSLYPNPVSVHLWPVGKHGEKAKRAGSDLPSRQTKYLNPPASPGNSPRR